LNKRQKEVIQYQLDSEKTVLEQLTKLYQKALNDIDRKIRILQSDELTQSRIYRIEYQKVLKKQVEAVLEKLHADEYTTIQQFLSDCYTDAFLGAAYDMFGQGVPIILPIDRNAAVQAVVLDSKISEGLYESLGVDTKKLKKTISSEITRGIASDMTHTDIARNIAKYAKVSLGRASTIVRTESHRIQQASKLDAQKAAKAKGANIVKQWNSTLDGDTRPSHRKLDGKFADVDGFFEMDGKKARYPGDFGDPAEDCNCRCQLLQRAKIALDEDELKTLQERAKFFELDKTDDLEDFKKKYLKAIEK
jgi:SPP1 gp7 family putative phage head morphogenesis protein